MRTRTRNLFLPWLFPVAGVLGACSDPGPPVENVVLILVDTLRGDAIHDTAGAYETPHIDALAADGVAFPRAFSHAPMTLPAHTSLFSSRLPVETGVLTNGVDVPADLPLLAEWLAGRGFDTRGVIGLGTLKRLPGGEGLARGFAAFDEDIWHIDSGSNVARRVRESLAGHDPKMPLFLFAHFSDPHSPYSIHDGRKSLVRVLLNGEKVGAVNTTELDNRGVPLELGPGKNTIELRAREEFKVFGFAAFENGKRLAQNWEVGGLSEKGKRARVVVERPGDASATCEVRIWLSDAPPRKDIPRRYASEVEYVDRYVGQVIGELKRRGLYESSLVIFTSDHGESLGERELFGHVENLTDEQIHVPLIVKLPRGHRLEDELAARSARLVSHIDLVPTILQLVQAPRLPGQQGTSLLAKGGAPHLAQTHKPEARMDKVSLRNEEVKLIYYVDEERFVMFDVENDPAELVDVFAERGHEVAEWCERLKSIGTLAAAMEAGEVSPGVKADLEALGYAR